MDIPMTVTTTHGNTYSYSRYSNKIIGGDHSEEGTDWRFSSLATFNSMPDVRMFVVGITEQCNLRCSYCCYSGLYSSKRTHSAKRLNASDIEQIYGFIVSVAKNEPIRFAFYGGEPLLHLDLIEYAVKKGAELFGGNISFSVSTNGTTLTPDVIEWLVEKKIEIAISIDGIGKYHDRFRKDAFGNGSFEKVRDAVKYIKIHHPEYINNVSLLMTLSSFDDLDKIAESWAKDDVFHDLSPANIHGLSPNFTTGVKTANYEAMRDHYIRLLDKYKQNPNWNVLRVYFDECISYWKDRPIVQCDEDVPMATCMPVNTKLYIDADKEISVCEKMPDNIRIGDIANGIDWTKANALVEKYYRIRQIRCRNCPAIRMCDMCLTALEFNLEEWDVLCQNERIYAKATLFLFCEMAERGLIA